MIKEQFVHNLGIMFELEVDKVQQTTIMIAGCGCIGGFSAEILARRGIGRIVLADPLLTYRSSNESALLLI